MDEIRHRWRKLSENERVVGYGAGIVLLAWLVGLFSGGFGASWAFLGAIVVIVIYWLKDTPNQSIAWPLPIPMLVLVISGFAALLAVLGLLTFGFRLGAVYGLGFILAALGNAIGAGVMAYGAWLEYQASPKRP